MYRNFVPVDTRLVLSNSTQVDITFSSAFVTSIEADLWSEQGEAYAESQQTTTDGLNEPVISFTGFPSD